MLRSLVGSEMCIRDRYQRRVRGVQRLLSMSSNLHNALLAGKGVVLRFGAFAVSFTGCYLFSSTPFLRNAHAYAAFIHYAIVAMVLAGRGSSLIGKNSATGQIAWWSFFIWWPFHLTTRLSAIAAKKMKGHAQATEVYPNLWVGGWYAFELNMQWAGVVDLCCELPERCNGTKYLACPTWDGSVRLQDVAIAAKFVAEAMKSGPVLVHCAHGVGRSTTVMRASLVEAGICQDIDEALTVCQAKRSCCKSSSHFQGVLQQWQDQRIRDQ
eukprot:TRINITY_DN37078_c0_g1_i3.p1 TRINITY_DN37078_c0_g1~~TRINITY_DN37078_c0_g1_i3.p1  ORF type:complete len:268 (-),score=41.65 TRINITY_DN37078_c0_g1_i3:299-1102(-)